MNELINVVTGYQGTRNVTQLSLIYSKSRRKFVRGFVTGSRVAGDICYRLYPGEYLHFSFHGWTKDDPPHTLTLRLKDLQLSLDGKVQETVLKEVELRFSSDEFLESLDIPQLTDFYGSRPGYHSRFSKDIFDKVYSDEDNNRLMKFLSENGGKTIWEGEEHE